MSKISHLVKCLLSGDICSFFPQSFSLLKPRPLLIFNRKHAFRSATIQSTINT